ncbi:MAG: arylesterase [Sphingomonadaceae bacterium]
MSEKGSTSVMLSRRYGVRRAIVQFACLIGLFAAVPAQAAEKLVVAFGDSLTAGYGLKAGDGFAPKLEAALRRSGVVARVHNAGVSGDTSAAGKARLAWVLNALAAKPDVVIVELGGNDMLRGIAPAQTQANLDAIVSELKRRKIRVVIAGMLASPNMGTAYAQSFNPIYPALARKHGASLYPFFMRGVAGNRALQIADGIHPNARGVDTIVAGIAPIIITNLR